MKKVLISLSIIAIVAILISIGVFGYSKFKEIQLQQKTYKHN